MTDSNLVRLTAIELCEGYRSGAFSPVEVAEAVLERIDQIDGNLTAFAHRDEKSVRESAQLSADRWAQDKPMGPLDGIPVSIKDVLKVKGWPTRSGSKSVEIRQDWNEDAPSVARLKEAGAVLIGMTTTPEFGWKGVTDSLLHGATRNPWNMRMTAGGSSGGAAAAIACGAGPVGLGTDGGGSVRIPAAFCGISALKPTFGRVAVHPPGLFGTLSHVGPMARSVRDLALLMNVIAHPDVRDPWSLPSSDADYLDGIVGSLDGVRIAFSPDLGYVRVEPEIAQLVQKAAEGFEQLGAIVDQIEPCVNKPEEMLRTIWYASAAEIVRSISKSRRRHMDQGLVAIAAEGERISALDLIEAERQRLDYAAQMDRLMENHDVLLTPTMPLAAFSSGVEVPEGWPHSRWFTWSPFTYPFNLTRQPALSVPCGFVSGDLPAAIQIVGKRHADALVLHVAAAYQDAYSTLDRWPSAGGVIRS